MVYIGFHVCLGEGKLARICRLQDVGCEFSFCGQRVHRRKSAGICGYLYLGSTRMCGGLIYCSRRRLKLRV